MWRAGPAGGQRDPPVRDRGEARSAMRWRARGCWTTPPSAAPVARAARRPCRPHDRGPRSGSHVPGRRRHRCSRGSTSTCVRGEQVLVLAGSGAGKSTLLRVLAGIVPQVLDAAVSGHVRVAGLDATRTPTADLAQHVGTLTQDPTDQLCLPTVLDEVGVRPREPWHRPGTHRTARSTTRSRRWAPRTCGTAARPSCRAARVSAWPSRLRSSRTPRVLLLDEPTALLDPAAARAVARTVRAAAGGRSTVLVEHRLDELGQPARADPRARPGRRRARGRPDARGAARRGPGRSRAWARGSRCPPSCGGGGRLPRAPSVRTGGRGCHRARPCCPRAGCRCGAVRRTVVAGVDLDVRRRPRDRRRRPERLRQEHPAPRARRAPAVTGHGRAAGVVGLVFQHPEHQFLARSVRDELAWGPRAVGRHRRRRAGDRRSARLPAVRAWSEQDPFRLSGGQQRRLSLAAMTVCGHDVLLADEPTFGQDRATCRGLRRRAAQARRRGSRRGPGHARPEAGG